jgi:hypothetical protein
MTSRNAKSSVAACEWCECQFVPGKPQQRYCSQACFNKGRCKPIEVRFWAKVNKTPTCWLWTASTRKGRGKYGQINLNGMQRAHRVSWQLAYGPIPNGLHVLHKCDVPACVRPGHLFLGTHRDNMDDARQKGRLIDGLHARVLSDDAYREIIAAPAVFGFSAALARKFHVTRGTICQIRSGDIGVTYRRSLQQRSA